MNNNNDIELSSHEGTRFEFNQSTGLIKLGIDVHQRFYVVVAQHGQGTPKPPQRFSPQAFLHWAGKLLAPGHQVHAVYEACGFGYGLYRELTRMGAGCLVIAPQKLDERNKRVKTDGLDAKALVLRLDRYLQGNKEALAVVRVPTEKEEQLRSIHRQREQLLATRKQLEAQGRSLLVNHGCEAISTWWKKRTWARLQKELPAWILARLSLSQPVVALLDAQIKSITRELEAAADPRQTPRGVGALTSVVLTREVCDWRRFKNRRAIGSYTGLCPSEYSSGGTRVQGCVTKHGNPRLRAALVELAWRMVRFQPSYPPIKKWRMTLAKGAATSAARKKAIVAVARQLAVDLWRLNTGQQSAAQLGLSF